MQDDRTILVVEDERLVAKDLQRTLQDMGYRVLAPAACADDAIRLANAHQPDLVLMDVRIEGERDGIETAEYLRANFESAIIFLTAYADGPTIDRAKLTEPHGYLVKPIKIAELRSAVEIALYKRDTEKHLRDRERWYSTTLRSIADGVITTGVDERVTFMNRAAEEITGWSANEATGHPIVEVFEVIDEQTKQPMTNPAVEALRERRAVAAPGQTLLRRRDGSEAPIDEGAAPIVDDKRNVSGAVLVFRDASEKRELQSSLMHADRLVSVGLLAAGVAHEINNPLAAVVANVELATQALLEMRSTAEPAVYEEQLGEILDQLRDAHAASRRIRNVVQDLKVFSRSEEDARGPIDVESVLESSLRMAHNEIRHRAHIKRVYDATPLVEASESRLGQVFLNIIVNAAQALDDRRAADNEIRLVTRTDDAGFALVEIHDTGSGMPPQVLARLFQPFFTTKPVGVGTGLGLSLCRRIVTGLGGSITIDSKLGEGTVVRVGLPPASTASSPPAALRERQPTPPRAKGRVLLIDDEQLILRSWRRALAPAHEVVTLSSATQAFERIRGGARFDVILCDLIMPQMTGMELYTRLVGEVPEQASRIVFVTGGAFTPAARAFLDEVPNRHLEKPVQLDELRALVQELVTANTSSDER